mgnify:CR=1 FL=1
MYKCLHDSVTDSLKLGRISDFAFRCWTNGLAISDWYGRLTAEPEKFIVKAFPNRREVAGDQVMSALDELAEVMAEGLIHLYEDSTGERYMVFHRHKPHNPRRSTHPRVTSSLPPPPKGLCSCIVYTEGEGDGLVGGREFRFYRGLFQIGEGRREDLYAASSTHWVQMGASGCNRVQSGALSSPPPFKGGRETGGGGGGRGGQAVDRLALEFERLTGRPAFRSDEEREKTSVLMVPILETRSIEELLTVMTVRIGRERKQGKKGPVSMRYFVAVFSDPRCFRAPQMDLPRPSEKPKDEKVGQDFERIREMAEERLRTLPSDDLSLWTREAEAEADRSHIISAYRPLFIKTTLADRAIRTFAISIPKKGGSA